MARDTRNPRSRSRTSQLVFVGYGVDAPEYGWNDYEGVDVHGQDLVMLVNDPGFATERRRRCSRARRMTYYGRWTYKFEEAARQGAAGALIVHDTKPARLWLGRGAATAGAARSTTSAGWTIPAALPLQGWITGEAAQQAASPRRAGPRRAARGGQQARLQGRAAGCDRRPCDAQQHGPQRTSRNVVALLPGTDAPDETVVYMAHWDHLGKRSCGTTRRRQHLQRRGRQRAPASPASWRSPRPSRSQPPKPERSVLFLAVTLEESGLLGSAVLRRRTRSVPLEQTVGVINLDAMSVGPHARDMGVVGRGQSELEDLLADWSTVQGRVLGPEESRRRAITSAPTTSTSRASACRRCTPRAATTWSKAASRPAWPRPTTSPRTVTTSPATSSIRPGSSRARCRTSTRFTKSAAASPPAIPGRSGSRERVPRRGRGPAQGQRREGPLSHPPRLSRAERAPTTRVL